MWLHRLYGKLMLLLYYRSFQRSDFVTLVFSYTNLSDSWVPFDCCIITDILISLYI